jgi:hypothetical protein
MASTPPSSLSRTLIDTFPFHSPLFSSAGRGRGL